MTEKELAIQFAKDFNEAKNSNFQFNAHGIPHFFDKFSNINLELLNKELSSFGLTIKQGNEIKCKSKFYQKEWKKFKTAFVFEPLFENNL